MNRLVYLILRSNFLLFGLVGSMGFAVDGGLLHLLVSQLSWGPVAARAVSIPVAVYVTWLLNHLFTFRGISNRPAYLGLARYITVSLAGAGVNFLVYSALVLTYRTMASQPLLPLAIASAVALVVNYLGSKHYAFR